jgi:hypothetical protein
MSRAGYLVVSSCLRNNLSGSRYVYNVTRIGVDDPRMSRIVVHNDVVYISGQTDTTASDSTCIMRCCYYRRKVGNLCHLTLYLRSSQKSNEECVD